MKIKHFPNRFLVHQSTYIKRFFKHFHIDKTHALNSLVVVQSLIMKKDPFQSYKNSKELLSLKVLYLCTIGTLMYLDNYTHSKNCFFYQFISKIEFYSNLKTLA